MARWAFFMVPVLFASGGLGACSFGCGFEPSYPDPPAGSYAVAQATVVSAGETETLSVARVTPAFFPGVRAAPLLGRLFIENEYRPGATAVAVLSHDYWNERFKGSPEIIGRRIEIDGRPFVVVGIGPRAFRFPGSTRLWIPDVK